MEFLAFSEQVQRTAIFISDRRELQKALTLLTSQGLTGLMDAILLGVSDLGGCGEGVGSWSPSRVADQNALGTGPLACEVVKAARGARILMYLLGIEIRPKAPVLA